MHVGNWLESLVLYCRDCKQRRPEMGGAWRCPLAAGKVKTIKNSFYFITFDPTQKGKQDLQTAGGKI